MVIELKQAAARLCRTLGPVAVAAAIAVTPLSAVAAEPSTPVGVHDAMAPLPEAPLSAEADALQRALVAAGLAEAVVDVYRARGFEPIWTGARLGAFLTALADAPRHGLPAARYDAAGLAALDAAAPDTEAAVTAAYLRYARDMASGLLEPRQIDAELQVSPPRPDEAALIAAMANAAAPATVIAALAPSHPAYDALLAEKARLETTLAETDFGAPLPTGRVLRTGATGAIVTDIRQRLGQLTGADLGESPVYDAELVSAIEAFQDASGLAADGVIGPNTFAALNATPEGKLRQVLVNLERQRWLNFDRGARHILVNQADFRAIVVEDGAQIFETRVVVGKVNKHRTPEFSDSMDHMVVNPTWHVPRSIATEEMLPRLKRNPGSLGTGMRIQTRSGTAVNPRFINFSRFNENNFPFVIKQRPGSRNALGRVKFMFPNRYNIYLHDTPAKALFNRETRAFSHGCVRVQRPFELAHLLLGPQSADPEGQFSRWLSTGRERRVNLETPVPIHLTYHTAIAEPDGSIRYRADIYGRDAQIFDALSAAGVALTPNAVEG